LIVISILSILLVTARCCLAVLLIAAHAFLALSLVLGAGSPTLLLAQASLLSSLALTGLPALACLSRS
jgi:hypothetical protein